MKEYHAPEAGARSQGRMEGECPVCGHRSALAPDKVRRAAEVMRLFACLKSTDEIAEIMGVTSVRVLQIRGWWHRHGLHRKGGDL